MRITFTIFKTGPVAICNEEFGSILGINKTNMQNKRVWSSQLFMMVYLDKQRRANFLEHEQFYYI